MDNDIQNFKELQKRIDQSAQLSTTLQLCRIELTLLSFTVATLADELDSLRNNVYKQEPASQRLHIQVLHTVLVLLTFRLVPLVLESLWRRVFQCRQPFRPSIVNPLHRGQSNSPAVPQNDNVTSESLSEAAHLGPSKLNAEPAWSVEYHPEAKRVLEFHLTNVVTYGAVVVCVNISRDGHRVAIGLGNGTTYLNELKTGSNIWLVSCYSKSRHLD